MSPNPLPSLTRSTPSYSSLQDTGSHGPDGCDFLNELEAAAEDDISSWLATGSHVKPPEEPSNAI